jgi:hypothetical protein
VYHHSGITGTLKIDEFRRVGRMKCKTSKMTERTNKILCSKKSNIDYKISLENGY